MPRSPDISHDLKKLIWDLWVYKSMNARQIANYINGDSQMCSKYGKIDPSGVHYHISKIRDELEDTVSEDALDSYVGEFVRAKEQLDGEIEDMDKLIKQEEGENEPNKELILKMRRFVHEIRIDRFKLLQDVELPIRIKKLKAERRKTVRVLEDQTIIDGNKVLEYEGYSGQGDNTVNQ